MRLHLHDSGSRPRYLVTKFTPDSDLHHFLDPFSYRDDTSTFFNYTLLVDNNTSLLFELDTLINHEVLLTLY